MYVTPIYPLSAPLTAGATISTDNSSFRRYGTLYNANVEYTLAYNGNRTLARIHNAEGYALPSNILFYHRKDHLGSIRSLWSTYYNYDDRYYPSGLPWSNDTGYDVGPYKYNGKEFIETHGLDEYDSYARWYYPAIMRTTTMDPLAEKYYNISPYAWCGNNPVNVIDPDGREAWEVNNKWDDDYINKFSSFVSNQTNQYVKDGGKFTCEDFALSLLIDFASTNGLPVIINNGSGTYDARSDYYTDVGTFKNDVLTTTGARDLQNKNNTVSTDIAGVRGGDIIVNRNNNNVGTHIQVVTASFYIGNTDFVNGVSVAQGNSGLLNGVPGSSSILGAGNPNSSFYTGKPIERGWVDVNANVYFNNTKGTTTSNYSNTKNIDIKRWNFSGF
jgi:RHS repeat-associated protein